MRKRTGMKPKDVSEEVENKKSAAMEAMYNRSKK